MIFLVVRPQHPQRVVVLCEHHLRTRPACAFSPVPLRVALCSRGPALSQLALQILLPLACPPAPASLPGHADESVAQQLQMPSLQQGGTCRRPVCQELRMPVKIHCPHPPAATLASCLEGALVSTGCAKSLMQRIARPLSVSRLGVLGVLRRGVPRQLPRLYM